MKHYIVSFVALFVAIASLVFAMSARNQRDAALAETRVAIGRIEQQILVSTQQREDTVSLSSKLAGLSDRLDRLEKESRTDDQLRLLTDISTQLQATAQKADKGARDIEGVHRRIESTVSITQASMNSVAMELSSIKEELKKKADAK